MRKAMFFFLAAIAYGILINVAKPVLVGWLGNSAIAQWTLMLLFLVPTVTLLAFFIRASQSHPPRSDLEKLKGTTNPYALLWSGHLPLIESFWCAYVPAAILFLVGVNYVTSRINRSIAGDMKWAIATLILLPALVGISMFGAWRSGDRYGGRRLWVVLSRTSMVIGTTAIFLSFFM